MKLLLKDNLKRKLEDSGIRVPTLARKTGVPRQTISNWLEGQKPQNIEQVKLVADYFKISLDELCFGLDLSAVGKDGASTNSADVLKRYEQEINAGIFEVILRRVSR